MSIAIDRDVCASCGRCLAICPGGLLEFASDRRPRLRYPADCWGCAACLKSCPAGALSLYLAPEAGGRGAKLRVRIEGEVLRWRATLPDGTERAIIADRRQADNY